MNSSPAKTVPLTEPAIKNPPLKQNPSSNSFSHYLWAENKKTILLTIGFATLGFFIFKLLYPFPDFFSDSYSYISAAYYHFDVNIWPIGYSWFLSLFHGITYSADALVYFQYLFFVLSSLYFYYTITYFYTTGKMTRRILYLFLFFDPFFYYLSNYVTSDILFASMSLVWLTQMIWVLNRPSLYQVLIQAGFMFICFTFRYNAMIYPLVAAIVFFLSRQKIWIKLLGILSGPLLIIPFIIFSSQAVKKMTGMAQFPPILGGWQWGNNGLYIREFIEEDSTRFPSPATAELDLIARNFFRAVPPQNRDLSAHVGNFFIQIQQAPLKHYMNIHYQPKTNYESVAAWGKVSPVFGEYGLYLIKRHPLAFARYYLLMNTKNYFIPSLEKLEIYNMGEDKIGPMEQFWFHFPNPKVRSISTDFQGILLGLFPFLFFMLNIYYIVEFYLFIKKGGLYKKIKIFSYSVVVSTSFLLLNFVFSIFANIIVIRYQVFPMIILLAFAMILTDYIESYNYNSAYYE